MLSIISSVGGFLFGLYAIFKGYKLVIRPLVKWFDNKFVKPIVVKLINALDRWAYSDYQKSYMACTILGEYLVKSYLIIGIALLVAIPCNILLTAYEQHFTILFSIYLIAMLLVAIKIVKFKFIESLSKAYCDS